MYTRCPECSTIFRVTAAQLRTAFGEVSCGSCQATFNALAALTDELPELTDAVTLDQASTATPDAESDEESSESASEDGRDSADEGRTDLKDEDEDEDEVDDNLVDTFVGETHETELSADEANDDLVDTIVDENPDDLDPDDRDPDDENTDDEPEPTDEPYDGHQGKDRDTEDTDIEPEPTGDEDAEPDEGQYEAASDVDTDDEMPADQNKDNAGSAWARILSEDDGRFDDRRELEIEARASNLLEKEPAEPAYDDHTGYEEILDEDDFESDSESASDEEYDESRDFDDLKPTAADESAARSKLASATADADEWSSFLAETPAEDADEYADESTPYIGDEDETERAEASAFGDEDEDGTDLEDEEYSHSWSDDDSTDMDFDEADDHYYELAAADDNAEGADPLIDYDPEFTPPWESDDIPPEDATGSRRRISKRSIAIAGTLVIALGLQLLHQQRDALAAHASWGGATRTVYAALGSPLYPEWDLMAYRISGSEAVAGRTAPAALDIVAKLTITGDRAVGRPMIRVELKDRWSNPIASRVFSADEYLREPVAGIALLAPGETLPIEISVADPGADALNYVVDVCLPRRDSGLECQIGKDPFQR